MVGAMLSITACVSRGEETMDNSYTTPLIEQRADPWIYRHTDGFYYFTATVPEYDRLELRRSRTIEGLRTAEPTVIWRAHESGPMGAHIWAPELHFIDGKWYIHFAAGAAQDIWAIRMYVLESDAENPLDGRWVEKGQIHTQWESFSLDATTFEHRGRRYLIWAQHPRGYDGNTALYIAEMDTPWSIIPPQIELTRPEYPWEEQLYKVNEGAAVLKRNGRIFVTYSASGTDHNYAMGLLTASENADLLSPDAWEKSAVPVFSSSEENGIYGPGHNSFTVGTDGTTDLLVYHARSYKRITGDPLEDPNRHTRVQPFYWNEDGTPNFGEPLPDTAR
jgi:GH43 family beta-xylosidase